MIEAIVGSEGAERVLLFLVARGEGYASEIASFYDMDVSTVQNQLKRMERDGLIVRASDPNDQRRTVVSATAEGMERVATLAATIEAHYRRLELTLGKQKLAQLYGLLDTLIEMEQT